VCAVLAFLLYSKPRFIASTRGSPYVMFDTKTAQACWSGAATRVDPFAAYGGHQIAPAKSDPFIASVDASDASAKDPFAAFTALNYTNPSDIPFCKFLK
jgi:hypothetical protein